MILVTGGLGFIGSHTCVELLNNNIKIIVIDNLSNSQIDTKQKIEKITNKKFDFFNYDLLDYNNIEDIFKKYPIDGIIHFAGFKAVSESIQKPIEYYENNIQSTINLLKLCKKYHVTKFIFSSSATVYGSQSSPLDETSESGYGITNPYGRTKYFIEEILKDVSKSSSEMKIISLRYFNPVGAHKSGLIGEDPNEIPNNLMPFVLRVAVKNNLDETLDDHYQELKIFGGDYDTKDGTAIRDFIHVVDLANAHIKALIKLDNISKINSSYDVYNIGTGKGTTVLELVNAFKKMNDIMLPYTITDKRDGDIGIVYCNSSKANTYLDWYPEKTLYNICHDTYNFALSRYKNY